MNELIQKSVNELTMSSREVATLCDKEHRNVCRDIENLNATYGQMGMLKIEQTPYTHEQNGQTYREFRLTKEQTIDLITGYRADLRIRINRRWQDFSTWIKNRIEKYEFVENADYLLHKFMEQTPSGAKHKTLLVFWLLPKNLMAVAQAKSTTSHLIWQNSLLW